MHRSDDTHKSKFKKLDSSSVFNLLFFLNLYQLIGIQDFIQHPKFHKNENDIAIIVLKTPFKVGSY